MTLVHLHLVLNHFPIIGPILGLGVLAYGIVFKNALVQRTGMGLFVLSALLAIPVYFTGDPAADAVKGLPGVTDKVIEAHEEAGEALLVAILILGAVSAAWLLFSRKLERFARLAPPLLLVGGIIVSALGAWTGNLGGQVRHTEVRAGAASSAAPNASESH